MVQPPSKRSRSDCKAASSSFDDPSHHVDSSRSAKKDAKLKLNVKREQRPHKSPLIGGSRYRSDRSHRGGSYHGEHHRSRECRDKTKSPRSPHASGNGLRSDRSHRSRSSQHRRHHRSREGRRRSRSKSPRSKECFSERSSKNSSSKGWKRYSRSPQLSESGHISHPSRSRYRSRKNRHSSRSPRSPQISGSGHSSDRSHRSKNHRRKRLRSREGRRRSRSPRSRERSRTRRRSRRRQPSHPSRRSRSKRRSSPSRSGERQPRSRKRSTCTSSFVADSKTVLDSQEDMTRGPESAREFAEKTPSNGANNKNSKAIAASASSSPQAVASNQVQDDSPSIQQAHSSHSKIDVHKVYGGNFGVNKLNQVNNYYNQGKPEENYEITKEEDQDLKDVLNKRAKEVSGEVSLPIKLQLRIQNEKLELAKGVNDVLHHHNEEELYYKREEVIQTITSPPSGELLLTELFKYTSEKASLVAEFYTNNTEATKTFINRHGNMVALIGQAGIGKSTLAREMVQLVLDKEVLPNCEYIFFIPFREVDFLTESTLFSFMMTGCEWEHSPQSDEAWRKKLKDNHNVVFIFDGLDEANTDQLYQKNTRSSLESKSKPYKFVRKIFSGQIFPLAKKVITSRPAQFLDLDKEIRPRFAVKILGLSPEFQNKLGKQICGDKFNHIKQFLNDHPDIASFLYIPVKCVITYAICSMAVEKSGQISVLSMTDLFVQALDHFVRSDHLRGKGDLNWKLAKLAWNGILLRKIIFTQEDFKNLDIDTEAFQAFLVTTTKADISFSILIGDKRSYFSHLLWQELFSAIYAAFFLPLDELQSYFSKLSQPLWVTVAKFMFGLFHSSVSCRIKNILPFQTDNSFSQKKDILLNFALNSLKQECLKLDEDSYYQLSPAFLQICGWIHETGDPELNVKVAACVPDRILLPIETMLPNDVTILLYVLQHTEKPIAINYVTSTSFLQDGLQRFLKGIANKSVTIEYLLFKEGLQENAVPLLVEILGCVRELELNYCNLSSTAILKIAQKLATLSQPMEELAFILCNIDDDVASSIGNGLKNIKRLSLGGCILSSVALVSVLNNISALSLPMENLNFSFNTMIDEVVENLVDALHNIKRINLSFCQLNKRTIIAITKKVASLPKSMDFIDLRGNDMDDDEVVASLVGSIPNVKSIDLSFYKLSKHAVSEISKKVASLPHPKPKVYGLK